MKSEKLLSFKELDPLEYQGKQYVRLDKLEEKLLKTLQRVEEKLSEVPSKEKIAELLP